MKYFFIVAVLAITASAAGVGQAAVSQERSEGGVAFTLLPLPGSEDVFLRVAWQNNWAFRKDVNQATPYVAADLLLAGGATGFPAGSAGERFADMQSEGRLQSTQEHVFGELRMPKVYMRDVLAIANAHLRSPALEQRWLERVRDGFEQRVTEFQTQPMSQGMSAFRWLALGDSPMRENLSLDTPGIIESVTREDVVNWLDSVITRDGATIAIAGDLSASEAGVAVDTLFEGLPEGKSEPIVKDITDFTPHRVLLHLPESKTNTLVFIGPMPPMGEKGEFHDTLLMSELGGDAESQLFEAIRTKLRASYGFYAGMGAITNENRFIILSGEVGSDKLSEVESAVREAYSEFLKHGTQSGLEKRIDALGMSFENADRNPEIVSYVALMALLEDKDPAIAFTLKEGLSKVTEDSLKNRLAEAFPTMDRMSVLAISPDKNALPDACVITAPEEAVDC